MINENDVEKLSRAKLKHIMSICKRLHQIDMGTSFVQHCHSTLHKAFDDVHISMGIYQLHPFHVLEKKVDTRDDSRWIEAAKDHFENHPLVERMFSMVAPETRKLQLTSTLKEFHDTTLIIETDDKAESRHQICIGLRDGNKLLYCSYSREREYTEEHLSMMCMIQSHMETAWKTWARFHKLKQELGMLQDTVVQSEEEQADASRLRRSIDALTQSQRYVANLVAEGKDNQQIADDLKISVLTVKKHLQMIFRKMEIRHRTELAVRWHRAHSISLY